MKKWTLEQLKEAIKVSDSISEVFRNLQTYPTGGNYALFYTLVKVHQLDVSNLTKRNYLKYRKPRTKIPFKDILIENSPYQNTSSLRQRLIKEGLLKNECYVCHLVTWLNNPISL